MSDINREQMLNNALPKAASILHEAGAHLFLILFSLLLVLIQSHLTNHKGGEEKTLGYFSNAFSFCHKYVIYVRTTVSF